MNAHPPSPSGRALPYGRAELARLIAPGSIAIVGASARPGSFGQRVERNLAGFSGRLHLVNARYDRLGDMPCHPSLSALPEVPDCIVVCTGKEHVPAVIEEAAGLGVGGAVVFASAFAETGKPEDIAAQARLSAIAAGSRLRIVGPNCLGVLNLGLRANMTFQTPPTRQEPRRGAIGLISQSGALGMALSQAAERGVCYSHVLTSGNSCDVDVADYIAYLAHDPACAAIACALEGVAVPARLIAAAEAAAEAGKPLVIYKMAASDQGAAAAMSHSGTFAGSHAAYGAALRRAGAVMVDALDALVETAAFFGKAPARPSGPRAMVLTTSGGASIMAADAASAHGVELPPLGPRTEEVLAARVPDFGSVGNPCDVTAQIVNDPQMFADCAGAMMADPGCDALVTPHVLAQEFAVPRIAVLNDLARDHGKIACNVWLSEWFGGPGAQESEAAPHVALFRSMDRCMQALRLWHDRAETLAMRAPCPRLSDPGARARVAEILTAEGPVLTERASKRVLAAYGIATASDHVVANAAEAAAIARDLAAPVVLKGEAASIPHKSEAGLVHLNLARPEEIAAAHDDLIAKLARLAPGEPTAVVLQPMIPEGVEIMIGGHVDPQFGPFVVLGLGGVLVELMKDAVLEPAPLGPAQAKRALDRLRGRAILDGFRHLPPVDRDRLAETVARFSELLADHAGRIVEADVNPLLCSGTAVIAVDGLIRKVEDRPTGACPAGSGGVY
ncbi:acetate--CoA ligase family protein [uncultured Paracoccus sp.]|uniref:acetate--CoA ligase family protein n=1 Tax=uncultured Paracoccus sp. TaxID=189685 RepID=UPI0025EA62E7|nr:acetate--CoA ligase family protein [uncultured Paracoccus sp.]